MSIIAILVKNSELESEYANDPWTEDAHVSVSF